MNLNNMPGNVDWSKIEKAEKLVDAMYTKYKINDTDKIHGILVGKYGLTDREADIAINNAQHDRNEKSYMESSESIPETRGIPESDVSRNLDDVHEKNFEKLESGVEYELEKRGVPYGDKEARMLIDMIHGGANKDRRAFDMFFDAFSDSDIERLAKYAAEKILASKQNSNKGMSINEVKKLQKIAGIISESQYQEAMSSQTMDFQLDPPDDYFGDDPSDEDMELEKEVEEEISKMAADLVPSSEDISKLIEKAMEMVHSSSYTDTVQKYANSKYGNQAWNIADDIVHAAMRELNITPDYDKGESNI